MKNQKQSNTDNLQEQTPLSGKKSKAGLVILILLLLAAALAVSGGIYYYHTEKQQPRELVERFLNSVQHMDFDSMESMLQSSDLSALDHADIRDDSYAEFFQEINQKMTYNIIENRFDLQNGTARITAHLKYIDGTDIYKETISEFIRQIVTTAFSGQELTEEETQEKLASILMEKSSELGDTYQETDIIYPVIKTDDQWKIVSLDEETVKIMSANFKSVESEIQQTLNDMSGDKTPSETEVIPDATDEDQLDMDTDRFSVKYADHKVAHDFAGNSCVLLYYDYTNNGSSASSAMVDVHIQAYQHGKECNAAIPEKNDPAVDMFMKEIQPGETARVCQAFSLEDDSDVTVRASEAFSFSDGQITSQILKLK